MRILCATDFSDAAREATRVAMALARRLEASVLLVHAIEPPVFTTDVAPVGMVPSLAAEIRRGAEQALDEELARVRGGGVLVEGQLLDGPAAGALLAQVRATAPELIVVATHGRRIVERALLGSVAAYLTRHAERPVLVVRDGAALAARLEGPAPLRLLGAVDFDRPSELAIQWIRALRAAVPCDVTFAHVFRSEELRERAGAKEAGVAPVPEEASLGAVERDLWRKIGTLPGEGRVSVWVGPGEDRVAEELATQAALTGAELVVAGTHARRGLGRLWRGSVADLLLRRAGSSVVCVPGLPEGATGRPVVPPLHLILAATDFSPEADRAVLAAYAMLRGAGGRVRLCHVAPEGQDPAPVRARLRALVPEDAEGFGIWTELAVLQGGDPARAIAAEAARLGAHAVAVGATRSSRLAAGLGRSVVRRLLRRTSVPVLVGPPLG